MAPRYERVNAGDADVYDSDSEHSLLPSPTDASPAATTGYVRPSSPPPSFHSRTSSTTNPRQDRHVDPALADAFESDADASDDDDENDDVRQRLVRQSAAENAEAHQGSSSGGAAVSSRGAQPATAIAGSAYSSQGTGAPSTTRTRIFGSGMQSDGVFSNLSARPEVGGQDEKEEAPPSYEQAAADQAPPYWETTILAPGLGGPDEVYLDGMPIGSFFSFLWNATISMSFQLVGFLLTYLLHSTHAAKNGSRAGLGVTLIQYGFYLRSSPDDAPSTGTNSDGYAAPSNPNSHDFDPNNVGNDSSSSGFATISASEWMSYIMMVVGWFILIRAVSDYLRARRHELLVLGNPESRFGVVSVFGEGEHPDRVV